MAGDDRKGSLDEKASLAGRDAPAPAEVIYEGRGFDSSMWYSCLAFPIPITGFTVAAWALDSSCKYC